MSKNIFDKNFENSYVAIKEYEKEKLVSDLNEFFLEAQKSGYPDCDKLLLAGGLATYSLHNLDGFVIDFFKKNESDYDRTIPLWFLVSYWENREEFLDEYFRLLFNETTKLGEDELLGTKIAALSILMYILNNQKNEVKDEFVCSVESYLLKEFEERKKDQSFENISLYELFDKYFSIDHSND